MPVYKKSLIPMAAALAVCLFALQPTPRAQGSRSGEHWVGTWATAVVTRPQAPAAPGGFGAGQAPAMCFASTPAASAAPSAAPAPAGGGGRGQGGGGRGGNAPAPVNFNNQTLRQIVHTSLAGERVRVVFSNAFGTAPLAVGAAHIALREKDSAIVAKSDRALTFGGSPSVNIPAGATVVSDAVALNLPAFADVAVDLYLPGDTAASPSPLTTHGGALQTNYISASGN